jgi:hypothetical protein
VRVGVGRGVRVRLGVAGGVRVGVRVVAREVDVRLTTAAWVVGANRVLLGMVGVIVTNRLGVAVVFGEAAVKEAVPVGTSVSVGTKAVTTCSVNPDAVSKLATARSRRLIGSRVMEI